VTGVTGLTDGRSDLIMVPARRLIESPVDAVFPLAPGDRPLVDVGESVVVGAPIAERLRDPRLEEVSIASSAGPTPGARWSRDGGAGPAGVRHTEDGGELLFTWRGKWRLATGDVPDPLEAPVAGIVREVKPGTSITLRATGRGIRGIIALGGPTRGRLRLASGGSGGLRPGGLDVGLAGTILVVGTRIDAETLTRARAMGIRGVIVAGLASKERRDFIASEARQRAALHRLPSYAVLIMDGANRRPMAGPLMEIFEMLDGREVAIVGDPPALVFDAPELSLPLPAADFVRVRGGPLLGREGRWLGPAGLRRFEGDVHLESGRIRLEDGTVATVALGDLERFA
jgi:hypothetical protein